MKIVWVDEAMPGLPGNDESDVMQDSDTNNDAYQILVVAYDDNARNALVSSLAPYYNVQASACATFCEAESLALHGLYRGILVDLATMIKAKAEEKTVAYTLTGFYPALRVKTMGKMLIPMSLVGEARQDKSLNDFLTKTCAGFVPRRLRAFKRKDICIVATINGERCFTVNVSWSGMFVANMYPEKFSAGDELTIGLPEFGMELDVVVARTQPWGGRRPPGIGVQYKRLSPELEQCLFSVLKSDKNKERDRIVA